MTLLVREPSGSTEIGVIAVREASGLSAIGEIWARDVSGLSQVFGQFSLTAAPLLVTGSTSSHHPQRINTGIVNVVPVPAGTITGAVWTFADTGWEAITPGSLSTAFRSPAVAADDTQTTTATCTVTRGGTDATIDIEASCTNFGT